VGARQGAGGVKHERKEIVGSTMQRERERGGEGRQRKAVGLLRFGG